jgi:hypothetical protein
LDKSSVKKCSSNFDLKEEKILPKITAKAVCQGILPWKNLCTHTPMFPLEVFGTKRSQEGLKKYLQNVCLNSWITNINIQKANLPITVYFYIYYKYGFSFTKLFSPVETLGCVFSRFVWLLSAIFIVF